MSSTSTSTTPTTPLPEGFTPSDRDVVIGKGKKFYFHAGNEWLRDVVAQRIASYSQAVTKADKSMIISMVIDFVNENGRFVKLDPTTGKFVYAEPLLCREKCSQTFRDNLAQSYRSSNIAKRDKRRQEQQDRCTFTLGSMGLCMGMGMGMMGMGFFSGSDDESVGMPPLKRFVSDDESVSMPPLKRMRYEARELQPVMSTVSIQDESEADATEAWFDWDTPLRTLEQSSTGLSSGDTMSFEFAFHQMVSDANEMSPINHDVLEPEPVNFNVGLVVSSSKFSSSPSMKDLTTVSNMDFGMASSFQRLTAAAFAA